MSQSVSPVRDEALFLSRLKNRHRRGSIAQRFFQGALGVGIVFLLLLLMSVFNRVVGLIAVQEAIPVQTLTDGRPIEELTSEELAGLLTSNLPNAARVYVRDSLIGQSNFQASPNNTMGQFLPALALPETVASKTLTELTPEDVQALLVIAQDKATLTDSVITLVAGREIVDNWDLLPSLTQRATIDAEVAANFPNARIEWISWLDFEFLTSRMTTIAGDSGIRTAFLGTLWVLFLTVLIAFPLGVGTAIYLEEYSRAGANSNWISRLIETNIRNLAGVPSIIYGLLGLAIFVRTLEGITQGRTILSAAMTMALLILPVIIINAQEALRAVPPSIREASFGLGASRWQTIWNTVLPAAIPGILTGTILGMSRAIGETAPLIIIGASTFIAIDPNGPLSKFTVIPIQIYNWTKMPSAQFQDLAAAGIILLLIVLLLFNATAIILRQQFRKRLQG